MPEVSAQALAESLYANDYQNITWREGTNKPLCSQFAAAGGRVALGQQKRAPEWLLIEWPQSDAAPAKYWLSNLPGGTSLPPWWRQRKNAGALSGITMSSSRRLG
ncbi:hypothetical protein [Vreelandella glaciei]|uniref:hypothetical protein n=1 Tax=Vreelandella glaciei TaxID=186761 RepID=UPI003C6EF0C9